MRLDSLNVGNSNIVNATYANDIKKQDKIKEKNIAELKFVSIEDSSDTFVNSSKNGNNILEVKPLNLPLNGPGGENPISKYEPFIEKPVDDTIKPFDKPFIEKPVDDTIKPFDKPFIEKPPMEKNKVTVSEKDGITTSIFYDSEGNKLSRTIFDSNTGNTSVSTYGENGKINKTTKIDAEGNVLSVAQDIYDENGNKIKTVVNDNVKNQTKTYEFDSNGKKNKCNIVDNKNGDLYLVEYNEDGKVVKTTKNDSKGNLISVSSYKYDRDGNKISSETISKNGDVRIYDFDKNGKKTKSTSTNKSTGITVETLYDKNERALKATKKIGDENIQTVDYSYDKNGNKTTTSTDCKSGNVEIQEYNSDGKNVKTIKKDKDGNISTEKLYSYNADGTVKQQITKEVQTGRQIIYDFATTINEDGSKVIKKNVNVKLKDSNSLIPNGTVEEAFNSDGKITESIRKDAKGSIIRSTVFSYDEEGDKIGAYEVNKKDNTITFFDYKNGIKSQSTKYKYKEGQIQKDNYSKILENIIYDSLGNQFISGLYIDLHLDLAGKK